MPPIVRDQLHSIAVRAMVAAGLEPDFSAAARQQLDRLTAAEPRDAQGVSDLRDRLWCSIDNDDSRDLDQLSVAETRDGRVRILVAVADVDALVKRDTPIDQHARLNTTSVYTPGGIFSMLPERLSTDLTSLNADGDRLALVIDMEVGDDGSLGASEVKRAWVRNHAKLAYRGVAAWLDGQAPPPPALAAVPGMDEQLRIQDRVAQTLAKRRHEQGALSLSTREARPVYRNDELTDLDADEANRAKQLIEDFMVAANGVVARFLEARSFPSLRRVLRSPERWERIVGLARDLGEKLPPEPDARALEAFLQRRRQSDPEHFADLSLSVVKCLGRGEYAVSHAGAHGEVPGHFGLAVRDYTHSTAPNRRFADLITQRLVKAALAQQPSPYRPDELDALAAHITQVEDKATKVERQVKKSAAASILAPRIGEHFDAIVTGASSKGTWVRISHPIAEGKVVRGAEGLDVADHVQVVLVSTDVERGFIDFARSR
jgi:exoribonuclease-2